MIGDRQMWRQYDLNIHRDLMLVCHCIFDVAHLVDDLISGFNLIIESIDFLGKTVKNILSRASYLFWLSRRSIQAK